jgi:ribosomal protein S18 acetylase RimI-like enzyme
MSSNHPDLDRAAWLALNGPQAQFGQVLGNAARYRPEFSPFGATDSDTKIAATDLAALVPAGEVVIIFGSDAERPGFERVYTGRAHQMVLDSELHRAPLPDGVQARELTLDDAGAVRDLVRLTRPGPWTDRSFELGRFLGVVEDGRLIAMTGERLWLPGYREVSAVCTHPEARGRGLAAALVSQGAGAMQARGEIPFLHVDAQNPGAERVYARLGFRLRAEFPVAAYRRLGVHSDE